MAQKEKQDSVKKTDKKTNSNARLLATSACGLAIISVAYYAWDNGYLSQLNTTLPPMEVETEFVEQVEVIDEPTISAPMPEWAIVLSEQVYASNANVSALASQMEALASQKTAIPSSAVSLTVVEDFKAAENLSHGVLGTLLQMTVSSYEKGGPQIQNLANLRNLMVALQANEEMISALDALVALTPVEGPVTLEELRHTLAIISAEGAPMPIDVDIETEESVTENVAKSALKSFFNSLISIEKMAEPDLEIDWTQQLHKMQLFMAQGRLEQASAYYATASSLQTDVRLTSYAESFGQFMQQREQLQTLLRTYVQTSLEMSK